MARGGARPGAGRPKERRKHKRQIARAEKLIADQLPWLVTQQLKLASGVSVVDRGSIKFVVEMLQKWCPPGETDRFEAAVERLRGMYLVPPDGRAIKDMLDRVMGCPTEQVEHSGALTHSIKIVEVERLLPRSEGDGG